MNIKLCIKNRLIILIMIVSLFTVLVGYGTFVYTNIQKEHQKTLQLSKTIGLILGQDFAKLILLNEIASASDITSSIKSFENIRTMVLYDLEKNPLIKFHYENKNFQVKDLESTIDDKYYIDGEILNLFVHAKYNDRHLGYIHYEFKIPCVYEVFFENILSLISVLIVMLILAYILSSFIAKRFTKPIVDLVEFLDKVDPNSSLDTQAIYKRNDEFGRVYNEINSMLKRIKIYQDTVKIAAATFESENGALITNKDKKILKVNRAFTKILGYEEVEVLGKNPNILQSGNHDRFFYDEMNKSLNENRFWTGEITNRHKNGSLVNQNLTITTVTNEKDEVLYYVASFIDITLLKQTEEALNQKEQILMHQSKMATMGEMIENITHQWKQPLSFISTITSTIQLKTEMKLPIDNEDEKALSQVSDNVKYLAQTIDDFRDFFKADKNKVEFDLKDTYEKVFNLIQLKSKNTSIEYIENLKSIKIINLENELIQVIINILNNARDVLNTKDDIKKLIFIDIFKEDNEVIICIKDNGGGINEDDPNIVFDAYFTKNKSNGTGIGLYMSKEIIEKNMNGKIFVNNVEYTYEKSLYKGAEFKIVLPIVESSD